MIVLRLFVEFFKIGLFSFGGGYGAIPVIRGSVLAQGWLTDEMFENVVAISESTPGPIMVNAATYIGGQQAGLMGAAAATVGVVLPSFLIILLVAMVMQAVLKQPAVQAVLGGIKPAVAGIILATGLWMAFAGLFPAGLPALDGRMAVIAALLLGVELGWRRLRRAEFSPIGLIVLAALLGMAFYGG